jgi:HEAT repeat protein
MHPILEKLQGGDRRSIGRSEEVVADVLTKPELFAAVFGGMLHDDPLVRMRSADAVEKITAEHPTYLAPYKKILLEEIAAIEQQEVRWHVAQMIPRLELNEGETEQAVEILRGYLNDKSKIVKTMSLQALADLAGQRPQLSPEVVALLKEAVETGSPAMRSRGKKLLTRLCHS